MTLSKITLIFGSLLLCILQLSYAQPASEMDIFQSLPPEKQLSTFSGFPCASFLFIGRQAKVVKPIKVARNAPWVWRARFWGHEPQADSTLLARGFHVVYCDVAELYGNAHAVEIWNQFYAFLYKAGLSSKVALEGFSRGGVYAYNWAIANPEKVSCVYADAPVLDLKSWPGGKGRGPGSAKDWEVFKQDYNLQTEEEAAQFKGSPLDNVEKIVKGGYPMLHVCGDADEVVPIEENTTLFEQRVKALGGNITVIHKPGVKHHPHSLKDPSPIVAFILRATWRD
ncbi:alpha/beta hydrolase family protein [Runella aurantiaca]|uniref:alpha/beta hydrolase family protein n=1 Tax=Runella aurantiaca TaxID=2282308 RepID=UPI001E5E8F00|nr:prolyl oligopeptidase family serine peptidase [Runella aurantiaca]